MLAALTTPMGSQQQRPDLLQVGPDAQRRQALVQMLQSQQNYAPKTAAGGGMGIASQALTGWMAGNEFAKQRKALDALATPAGGYEADPRRPWA